MKTRFKEGMLQHPFLIQRKDKVNFMFSMEELNELISAIFKLIDKNADVSLTPIAWKRVKVEMNGEYFGIYDFQRHTFVD